MCVIVSLKIDLDATAILSHMESRIEEAERTVMKAALKQAIEPPKSSRKAALRVEVPLKRLRCHVCCQLFRPAEQCLVKVKGHNVTPVLRELAALMGSSWPYGTAAGVLKLSSAPFLKGDRKRGDDDSEASWVGVPTPRVWPAD